MGGYSWPTRSRETERQELHLKRSKLTPRAAIYEECSKYNVGDMYHAQLVFITSRYMIGADPFTILMILGKGKPCWKYWPWYYIVTAT